MKRKQMVLVTLAAVTAALVGGMLGAWLFAPLPVQAQQEDSELRTISVNTLQLIDEEGNLVGQMSANGGEPIFWLEDNEGGYIDLKASGGEAFCRTFLGDTVSSMMGTSGFLLLDESGASMEVGFNNNGQPELKTFDSGSELVTYLGPIGLLLCSEEGTKISIDCHDEDIALRFFDRHGNVRCGISKEALMFADTTETHQLFLGVVEEQGCLGFFDSAGNIIWDAP